MKKQFKLISFSIFFASFCYAQDVSWDGLKNKFPDENALMLKHKKIYTISFEEKKVVLSAESSEESIALTDIGIPYINSKNLYSSAFVKNKIKEAKTFSLSESGKYKTITATNIKEKSDMDGHVFFDDSKTTTITYPSVTAGSITSLQSIEEYDEIRFFGAFYFESFMNTLESEVTIKAHKDIQIKYLLQNCADANIEFSLTEKGKFNYYTWKAKNMPKYSRPESAPNLRHYTPHILFYISSYIENKDTVKVLSSPTDLYKWYADRIKNVNSQKSEAIKKITDSLVIGTKNEFEKVRKIFYWVQDNIKYIAFEDGLGGFVPREANAIYEKRYGDCKDMASIITQMLRIAKIKSYLTWLGTRDIPYKYSEVPTPLVDNHMIAAYKDTTGKIWLLDATGKNATIDLYTSMIQGKQALIGIDSANFELYDIPIVPKEKNLLYDSIHIEINNEQIAGSGKLLINGYPKIQFDYLISNLTSQKLKDELKSTLDKGNNTFNLTSCDVLNADNRETTTTINYTCKIDNYVKSYQNEKYFNFHLDKNELQYMINDSRGNIPIEFDNTISESTCVVLQIPEGYEVNYLPENTSYKNADFGYTIEYEKKAKSLVMKKYFFCNKLMIYSADFSEWTKMLKSLNKSYNESIILKHN